MFERIKLLISLIIFLQETLGWPFYVEISEQLSTHILKVIVETKGLNGICWVFVTD